MELIQMNKDLQAYLKESNVIDFSHPLIQEKVKEFTRLGKTKEEQAELAFNFARDEIKHSFDIDGTVVTTTASEAMEEKEGICFAKAHVLAALLRVMGIPTGFCYQRVTKKKARQNLGMHYMVLMQFILKIQIRGFALIHVGTNLGYHQNLIRMRKN